MEQIEAFWDGALIGDRMEGDHKVECRQIDGFYVEYKFDITGEHYIDMRSFNNPDLLQPYFDQMGKIKL